MSGERSESLEAAGPRVDGARPRWPRRLLKAVLIAGLLAGLFVALVLRPRRIVLDSPVYELAIAAVRSSQPARELLGGDFEEPSFFSRVESADPSEDGRRVGELRFEASLRGRARTCHLVVDGVRRRDGRWCLIEVDLRTPSKSIELVDVADVLSHSEPFAKALELARAKPLFRETVGTVEAWRIVPSIWVRGLAGDDAGCQWSYEVCFEGVRARGTLDVAGHGLVEGELTKALFTAPDGRTVNLLR